MKFVEVYSDGVKTFINPEHIVRIIAPDCLKIKIRA